MSGESPDRSVRDRERESSEKTSEDPGRVPQDAKVPGDEGRKAAAEGAARDDAQGGDGGTGIAGRRDAEPGEAADADADGRSERNEGEGDDADAGAQGEDGAGAVEGVKADAPSDATTMLRLPASGSSAPADAERRAEEAAEAEGANASGDPVEGGTAEGRSGDDDGGESPSGDDAANEPGGGTAASGAGDRLTADLRLPADARDKGTTELRSPSADEAASPKAGDKGTTELRSPASGDAAPTGGQARGVSGAGSGSGSVAGSGDKGTTELRPSEKGREGVEASDGGADGEPDAEADGAEADGAEADGAEAGDHATRMLRLPASEKETGDRLTTELRAPSEEADSSRQTDEIDEGDKGDKGDEGTTQLRLPAEEKSDTEEKSGTEGGSDATAMLRLPATGKGPDGGAEGDAGEDDAPEDGKAAKGSKGSKDNKDNKESRGGAGDGGRNGGKPDVTAAMPVLGEKDEALAAPPRPSAPPKGAEGTKGTEGAKESKESKGGEDRASDSRAAEPASPAKPDPTPSAPPEPEAAPPAPVLPPKPEAAPPPADADRDPLELLAALTNKPAPPPTPLRTLVRRVKIWTPLAVLALILLVVAQVLRPLPEPGLELTASETYTFEGELGSVPWPEQGQAQLDVQGLGSFGSSGEQEPVPIASVAKVMTAYVILRDHPMDPETDGASIPVDQQAEDEVELIAENESIVEVTAGQELTQREAIQAIMIASANNVARLLARWDAGSEEAFVEKMNEAAEELGMTDTTYTDPSGLRPETVSTAADQTKLGREVMKDPFFREVVRMPSYVDSEGKEQLNWNHLVPLDGVVGIKTGTTTTAGGNLLFAAEQQVGDNTQLIVGAVLAQPPHPSDNSILTGALTAGKELIDFGQEQLVAEPMLAAGDVVGEVDDGLGGGVPLVITEDLPVVGWPGLDVGLELVENADGVPGSGEAGTVVGTLRAGDGEGAVEVPVALGEALSEPSFGARLTRIT
ncbi:D-alanyl-D-alanine carboxypeptidase [Streptomyces zhaozhouensis]|uniref:D-alanyl-D-alanine carboxypeptidase n=1 Tax=Streptomyces zhaozhouensis TaxID=1300267 RepID=A0A286DXV4_9ACTN|nr:D-alanyl-D-alanine carboxypeptidase [Streptomyces zhaozhouensis]SOD63507.1 D-alanyl-D-alanine carboxypeptidase [Streptomyces zhaozhouensis]